MTRQNLPESRSPHRTTGFTLIEILVVVAIIVVLLAILIPALSGAKSKAYAVKTTAQMQAISNGCDQYYIAFQAYPGPLAEALIAPGLSPAFTGSQNMAIGLLGTIPASGSAYTAFNYSTNSGPLDWSNNGRQYQAFCTSTSSNYQSVGGVGSANPVFLDAYPDALPILYYRRSSGVDGTNANSVVAAQTSSPKTAAYYWGTNANYTNANVVITSPSGSTTTQNGALTSGTNFQSIVASGYTSGSPNAVPAQGGFMLISAGADRNYGIATGKQTSDDIVLFGGQ